MTAIAYPAALPGPQPGSFAPRERRAVSSIEGPPQQRARQRDAAGLASQYTYVYTPAEMAAWLEWYQDTLLDGRRWFAHSLPGPNGLVPRVVRYRSVHQQLLGVGIYRVSASFEQRGASLVPIDAIFLDAIFLEDFESGLGLYSVVSGNGALFAVQPDDFGACLHVQSQNAGTPAIILRPLAAPVAGSEIRVRFRIDANASDDAASIALLLDASMALGITPRREAAIDALGRCHFSIYGAAHTSSAALALQQWHELVVSFAPGVGNTSYSLFNLVTSTVVASGSVAIDRAYIEFDRLRFTADSGGATCPTSYDEIRLS